MTELLETIYGPNTVVHMMSGKAVSRSLRGHLLTESALMCKIIADLIPSAACCIVNDHSETLEYFSEGMDSALAGICLLLAMMTLKESTTL